MGGPPGIDFAADAAGGGGQSLKSLFIYSFQLI